MKHYRIYFLGRDGKIDGRPVETEASSDDEVIMRALMAERNTFGAEVWCGAALIRRVDHSGAFVPSADTGQAIQRP